MENYRSCQHWQRPDEGPTNEQYAQFLQDTQWAHFVTRLEPPWIGVKQCIACLQFSYYKPNTPRNDMFLPLSVDWEGEKWCVVSIPIDDIPLMQDMAEGSGLQVVEAIPVRTIGGQDFDFPFNSSTMFTILPRPGLEEHLDDPFSFYKLVLQEQETISWILGEQKRPVLM
jgi:hypothetical protein